MIARLRRAVGFARHMPAEKLFWRARLTVQRRWSLRRPVNLGVALASRDAAAVPQPVFAPRGGRIERTDTGWAFTFVGRRVVAGDPVDWTTPGFEPRDQLWRMNLHYMEYLETLCLDDGIDLIRQWIGANPPWQPGYWHDSWNSYALSLRVMCWMQFLARHGAAGQFDDIELSLAQQMRFLDRNLERDLGGNHLMKNIKALVWAGAYFEGDEAQGWRRTGLGLLEREIAAQILADGVHYERSPSYHAQVLADLIEIRVALGEMRTALLDDVIERMARVAIDLSHPGDVPALFNDAGRTMAYSPAECAALAGVMPQRQRVFGYRDAGYFGAHPGDWSIVADMGRIGPDDLPAHAHGDIGGFELSVGGRQFVVDQGVYEYVAGDRRTQSRAAASHSVLAIDGMEQAEFFGAFRCGDRPDVTVDLWQPRDDGFVLVGTHDGYRRTGAGPRVTRRFDVTARGLTITDTAPVPAATRARVGLLLHPDCQVEIAGASATIGHAQSAIRIDTGLAIHVEDALWWPDMGVEVATKRLYLTWPSGTGEGAFTFTINPII